MRESLSAIIVSALVSNAITHRIDQIMCLIKSFGEENWIPLLPRKDVVLQALNRYANDA